MWQQELAVPLVYSMVALLCKTLDKPLLLFLNPLLVLWGPFRQGSTRILGFLPETFERGGGSRRLDAEMRKALWGGVVQGQHHGERESSPLP